MSAIASGSGPGKNKDRNLQACEMCRKRKIKCDGKAPCSFCMQHKYDCKFVEPKDPAANARRVKEAIAKLESRVDELDDFRSSVGDMLLWYRTNVQNSSTAAVGSTSLHNPPTLPSTLRSLPALHNAPTLPDPYPVINAGQVTNGGGAAISGGGVMANGSGVITAGAYLNDSSQLRFPSESNFTQQASFSEPDGSASTYSPSPALLQHLEKASRQRIAEEVDSPSSPSTIFSHYTRDANGKLRYIGGSSSLVLVDAIHNLREGHEVADEDDEVPFLPRGDKSKPVRGIAPLSPSEMPSPAVADALVGAYLTQIHPTVPIVPRKTFLEKYFSVMRAHAAGRPLGDVSFMSLLWAVFACASALKPASPALVDALGARPTDAYSDEDSLGFRFYERAKLLMWSVSDVPSLEQVQCIILLATWNAGGNRLAQAWIHTATAIRVAQDLGLHRSPRALALSVSEKEHRRRVWSTLYVLDRVLSTCLGRPFGIVDEDGDAETPSEVPGRDYTTAYKVYVEVNVLLGQVVRTGQSTAFLQDMLGRNQHADVVARLEERLHRWLGELPSRVSAAADRSYGSVEMQAVALLAHVTYHACVLTLHRPLIGTRPDAVATCTGAARHIIRYAERAHPLVPNSHHLAFLIQMITLSAIILLRALSDGNTTDDSLAAQILQSAQECCSLLQAIESRWLGARRCREIINALMVPVSARWGARTKRRRAPGDTTTKRVKTEVALSPALPEITPAPDAPFAEDAFLDASFLQPNATSSFDFDLESFALGNSASSLPFGFDFLNSDMPSFRRSPSDDATPTDGSRVFM